MMPARGGKVLVVGLDPLKLNPADWGVSTEHNAEVRAKIAASEAALSEAGYHARFCLLALDDDLDATLVPELEAQAWDCVIIGGGIRKPEELFELFERVLNLVHRHAPQAAIGFNNRPDDVLEAVARCSRGG